jgi:hypothetical protein
MDELGDYLYGSVKWDFKLYGDYDVSQSEKKIFLEKNKDKIIIAKDFRDIKQFSIFDNPGAVYDYMMSLPPTERCLYEVIVGSKEQKPHFDLDIEVKDDHDVDHVRCLSDLIINICLELDERGATLSSIDDEIDVYSSHGMKTSVTTSATTSTTTIKKYSYHVVVNSRYHNNNLEANAFAMSILRRLTNMKSVCVPFFDHSVYKSVQQFRLLFCSKLGKNRFKKQVRHWELNDQTHVSPEYDDKTLFFRSLIGYIDISKSKMINTQFITKPINSKTLKDETIKSVTHWVIEKYPNLSYDRVDGILVLFKNNGGYMCPKCQRLHDHINPYVLVGLGGRRPIILFYCRRNTVAYKISPKILLSPTQS